ncbi:ABC transporter ATP-binding protein [Pusillimonas sp.]|uniref:ABC transporter ATP-binding protein n=1 Tax=Pusillimonas sp. TaxID=3040095 RepID=UPI0037C5573F
MRPLLEVFGLTAGYQQAVVLEDLSLSIQAGRTLALLGRNGVGKSTFLETLMGNTTMHAGRIEFNGVEIGRCSPVKRARLGLGWVPQEREVFASLTVRENLQVVRRPGPWDVESVFQLFPRLCERAANYGNQLSGGEQQMLAIGRALATNPRLLLLDEPMEGLAPIIVEELSRSIQEISARSGLTCIVVEQHPALALRMAADAVVLQRGRVAFAGPSGVLEGDKARLAELLSVGGDTQSLNNS